MLLAFVRAHPDPGPLCPLFAPEPHLFKTAVETQLAKLRDERDAQRQKEEQLQAGAEGADSTELALYRWALLVRHGLWGEVMHLSSSLM